MISLFDIYYFFYVGNERVGVIIFGSVWFLPIKNNQTGFFLKKKLKPNRN